MEMCGSGSLHGRFQWVKTFWRSLCYIYCGRLRKFPSVRAKYGRREQESTISASADRIGHIQAICILPDPTLTGDNQSPARALVVLSPTLLWPLCLSRTFHLHLCTFQSCMRCICGYSHGSPGIFTWTRQSFLPVTWIADAVVLERWIASFSRHLQVRTSMPAVLSSIWSVGLSDGVHFTMFKFAPIGSLWLDFSIVQLGIALAFKRATGQHDVISI